MRASLQNVLQADLVLLLPGWQRSRGARLEITVARAIGCEVRLWVAR